MFYVFETEAIALAASEYVTTLAAFPIVSRNAETGEPEPSKAKTETYLPKQRADGKWVLSIVPESVASQYPQSVQDHFNEAFPHTHEPFSFDWFPVIEE